MKKNMKIGMVFVALFSLVLFVFSAVAADPEKKARSPKQQAQYQKMKDCNAEAKVRALKGDERKKFMSSCLKGKSKE